MQKDFSYGKPKPRVAVVQKSGTRRIALEQLALSCNAEIVALFDPDDLHIYGRRSQLQPPDFILTDITSNIERSGAYLDSISEYLNEHGTQAVIWIATDMLDTAYAVLPVSQCHLLLDAPDIEAMPILAGAVKQMKMQGLKQQDRVTDYGALNRISDELADFARTLARIAEQDEPVESSLNDKPVSFRPAPAAIFDRLSADIQQNTRSDGPKASEIRSLLKSRRKRDAHFNAELFADPAWDILLDLFAARLEGKKVSVSSLCIAAAVPPTTALRWISAMTEDGILLREHDPDDARRVFIRLSDSASESLVAYFTEIKSGPFMPI